ncbi:MAG: nucleotide sugar dehydrogenase, partial [Nitrospinaceae bacterium]
KKNTINKITKVIAGQTEAVTDMMENMYGAMTNGNTFRAKSIKAAEASKVIENAQRDLNIAFINEAAIIFSQTGLSIYDVLEAARTKWNFLDFKPGLVGGHCIGVDPYYLAHFAEEVGLEADLILTARRTNDAMAGFIASDIAKNLKHGSQVLVLSLTFKEDVPDLRNSRVIDLIRALKEKGLHVDVYDPVADSGEVHEEYGIRLMKNLSCKGKEEKFDAIIGAVAHKAFKALNPADMEPLIQKNGLVGDIKGIWRNLEFSDGIRRWFL